MPSAHNAPHRGTRAIQRLVEFAPSTGGLALWIGHGNRDGADVPDIQTDGRQIFYGPGFAARALREQTGLVAHEVLHIALRHAQRYLELRAIVGDVDLQLFNICADAIVNSTIADLDWLTLPIESVRIEQLMYAVLGVKESSETLLLQWDVERLYRLIDDRRVQPDDRQSAASQTFEGSGATKSATASNPSRSTSAHEDGQRAALVRGIFAKVMQDLAPDPSAPSAPEDEAEHVREWSERLLRGHASDGAFSLMRTLGADVPQSRVPWEQLLRAQLARHLLKARDVSWSRPARSYIANQGRTRSGARLPFEPGLSWSRSAPRLAVIIDVSGSIPDELMLRFRSEIDAICRRQEAGLTVIIGDDRVRSVVHANPGHGALDGLTFAGGGGTDFAPLLIEAAIHRPDVAVVLTDLDGPAGSQPRFPVIWAVTSEHADMPAPFGRKLVMR